MPRCGGAAIISKGQFIMTDKENVLAHWDRMIAWVKKQPEKRRISFVEMKCAIGETFGDHDCVYCAKYHQPYCRFHNQ